MNREYEIIRLKLEDSNQPTKYFTEEFYKLYLEYRRGTGETGDYTNPIYYENVRNTDFFSKTPAAFSEFVRIYRDRLPKYCIDFRANASDTHIQKRMIEKFENETCARNYAKRWAMYFGDYCEINKIA